MISTIIVRSLFYLPFLFLLSLPFFPLSGSLILASFLSLAIAITYAEVDKKKKEH